MDPKLQALMNSPMLWLASSIMVIVVLAQSATFMNKAFKVAQEQGVSKDECKSGLRAACLTAIGPALAPCIVLVALMATLGAPTAWMRMNDIGAARTELAMSTISVGFVGGSLKASDMSVISFAYALWGMALNNMGWMWASLILSGKMGTAVEYINKKYDQAWVKMVMAAAALGLFSSLWSSSLINVKGVLNNKNVTAGIASFFAMLILSRVFKSYPRIQELGLGISMLAGMFLAAYIY